MPVNLSTKNLGLDIANRQKFQRNPMFEAGLVLVICALFSWFILLPKQSDVGKKQDGYNTLSTQEQGVADKVKAMNDLVVKLHANSDSISKLDEALPLDGDFIKPRLLIQKLADDSGVTVGDVSVSAKSGEIAAGNTALLASPFASVRTQQTVGATAYVLGSFVQLQDFLRRLETSGRLINVNTMAIAQDSQGVLNMRLNMNLYYLAP